MEKFTFDKFIDDICKREEDTRRQLEEHAQGQEEHPQRIYNRLYREHQQNRIVYRRPE
jgi:hypothetical protein